ncbi:hypothetical protein BCV70DRAFT_112216 [Testicularia cyperi]|uniref:Uncharacterized protein n=1 Tax=Testicularia cyperi TaxID=1882483 RepID=A0A317XN49_9BASI|nr:hypothetical protein BCV70DRAFT_112216 [Testicularia cyperi]
MDPHLGTPRRRMEAHPTHHNCICTCQTICPQLPNSFFFLFFFFFLSFAGSMAGRLRLWVVRWKKENKSCLETVASGNAELQCFENKQASVCLSNSTACVRMRGKLPRCILSVFGWEG